MTSAKRMWNRLFCLMNTYRDVEVVPIVCEDVTFVDWSLAMIDNVELGEVAFYDDEIWTDRDKLRERYWNDHELDIVQGVHHLKDPEERAERITSCLESELDLLFKDAILVWIADGDFSQYKEGSVC